MFFKRLLLFLTCLVSAKGVSLLVDKGKIMTPEITVPYFSGAALSGNDNWVFNLNEVDTLKKLNLIENIHEKRKAIDNYRFSSEEDSTHQYQLNQPGDQTGKNHVFLSRRYRCTEIISTFDSLFLLLSDHVEF